MLTEQQIKHFHTLWRPGMQVGVAVKTVGCVPRFTTTIRKHLKMTPTKESPPGVRSYTRL